MTPRTCPELLYALKAARQAGDPAIDEAYDGLGHTLDFYWSVFNRNSVDGHGLALNATVHIDPSVQNAQWDGQRMLFADGDGELFNRFTAALEVIGHELTDGITQYEANLLYLNRAGALNESLSDVFGIMIKHRRLAAFDHVLGARTAAAGLPNPRPWPLPDVL